MIKRLSDESKKNILFHIERNPAAPVKKYEADLRNKDFKVFYNAPCLVYIGSSKKVGSIQVDCALAASHFIFSVAAKDFEKTNIRPRVSSKFAILLIFTFTFPA